MSLRRDLSAISDDEFVSLLDSLSSPVEPNRKKTKGLRKLPRDAPIVRIATTLREKGLPDNEAQSRLRQALLSDGVAASSIPSDGAYPLEQWLETLLQAVSSSVVLHLAKSI